MSSVANFVGYSLAKAGVMIRETLDAGSTNAFVGLSSGVGVDYQSRTPTLSGTFVVWQGPNLNPPYWFAEKLSLHETGLAQYCEPGRADTDYCESSEHEGLPILGAPAGYGLLQRDPLPKARAAQIMWNWKEGQTDK